MGNNALALNAFLADLFGALFQLRVIDKVGLGVKLFFRVINGGRYLVHLDGHALGNLGLLGREDAVIVINVDIAGLENVLNGLSGNLGVGYLAAIINLDDLRGHNLKVHALFQLGVLVHVSITGLHRSTLDHAAEVTQQVRNGEVGGGQLLLHAIDGHGYWLGGAHRDLIAITHGLGRGWGDDVLLAHLHAGCLQRAVDILGKGSQLHLVAVDVHGDIFLCCNGYDTADG